MFVFAISDKIEGHWPTFAELVHVGIPRTVAKHYEIVRRDMTEGIRERIAASKN
jgi:hypothetical protein